MSPDGDDRGQRLRGVDERESAQAEGVCHEAGEGVGAYLAFACARLGLDDPEQTGRYAGAVPCVYVAEIERVIFRAAAPIVHSLSSLTDAQRGELLPNIVRVMLAAFLEEQAR